MTSNNSQFKQRIENIKKNVPIRSILEHFGVQIMGSGIEEQIRCPFHGHDQHASARIYATNTMYCWVCEKSWDVLSVVQDKLTTDFKSAIRYIEEKFKVPVLSAEEYVKSTYKDYSFLDRKIFTDKNDEAYEKDFEKTQNFIIKNKDSMNFDRYVKIFNDYDTLYFQYKMGIEKQVSIKLNDLIRNI